MKHTYHDRLVAGLTAMGYKVVNNKSRYAFLYTSDKYKLFVGANGALRSGECATASHSIGQASSQSTFYKMVLVKGDAALAEGNL